jgi:REP element-mobilizing transposase RayT
VHHLIIRGIERRKIFLNEEDYEDFLERLATLLPQTKTVCYAWSLLPNHAHLLVRTGVVPLAHVMRRLLTGYAVNFNRRHQRRGHLFQNRYKSILCQEDAYLRELVRYIHLNTVRVGLVADLEGLKGYPYCGHSALLGRKVRPWQDVGYVLGYFGQTVRQARRAYVAYVEAGTAQGRREELTGGGLIRSLGGWAEAKRLRGKGSGHVMSDERILGDSGFVESVLSLVKEEYEGRYELKRRGYDLERIAGRVAELYGMEKEEVFSRGRQKQKVQARSLLCYWAVREAGISFRTLAKRLGISAPGVGYAVERGEGILRENQYELIE